MKLTQVSFSSGEVSPAVSQRVDLARYQTALKTCRNFFVLPTGGVANRPGTKFVNTTKYADKQSILIPFIFSAEQAYMLEFGEGYIRIYADGGVVQSQDTVATVTNITDGIVGFSARRTITTAAPHGLSVNDSVFFENIVATGSFDINGGPWTVLSVPSSTSFRIIGSGDPLGGYTSGGDVIANAEIANPYSEDDLVNLRFTQSADVLTVVHPDYPPHEFRRLSADSFEFEEIDEFENGPFLDVNADETIFVHASAVMGVVTLTSTTSIFTSDQIGSLFRLDEKDLSTVVPWEPSKLLAADTTNPFGIMRRSDGKVYRCVTDQVASGEGTYTGTVRPNHDNGVAADGDGQEIQSLAQRAGVDWEYVHSGFGIVRITAVGSGTSATAQVIVRLPETVVGGATTANGPWTMTGDGSDTTLSIAGATSEDENQYEVTFDGVIQPTNTYSVNSSTDVLTFFTAPATGVSVSARQLSANNRTNVWAFGAWSEDQGYPSVATYYQDRLVFAATTGRPQTEWASQVGDYHNFGISSPLLASDSISQTLNARQINAIRELVPLDQLIALTASSAWASPKRGEAWTPETIGFDPQSYKGCAPIRSVLVDDSAIYVQEKATKVRDLRYSLEADKFSGGELTVLSRHLFSKTKTIVDIDYATEPHGLLPCVRSDGVIGCLTYLREQDVVGWGRFDTLGYFERVCVIPEDGRDAIYTIVRRTINGSTARFVERFSDREFEDLVDAFFVDCGLTFDGRENETTASTFSGLDHLEGESVVALADGNVITGLTVENGSVTLEDEYSVVHIGLPYVCDVETLDVNIFGRESIRDTAKNIPRISVVLQDTRGLQVGSDENHLEEIINRDTENYDEATQMINGVGKVYATNTWDSKGRIFMRQSYPLPATILAVSPSVELGGDG